MVEGTPLLREHTGQNLYPGFESLRLRQIRNAKLMFSLVFLFLLRVERWLVTRFVTRTVPRSDLSSLRNNVREEARGQVRVATLQREQCTMSTVRQRLRSDGPPGVAGIRL